MAAAPSETVQSEPNSPLRRDIRSPGAWRYLLNYILLGAASLILIVEIAETGIWRTLWMPIFLIGIAVGNLARMQAADRKLT